MHLSHAEQRHAFNRWLRTGHLPPPQSAAGVELKFNPYHDPRNGRFTFAPGHWARARRESDAADLAAGPPIPRGGNSRAMDRPMTLEQAVPGLRNAPGGAIVAVADSLFDFTGPAQAMTAEILTLWRRRVLEDIRAVDPTWREPWHLIPTTTAGMQRYLDDLRLQRSVIYLNVRNDPRPLQVEILRMMQQRANSAYMEGLRMLRAKQLSVRLNDREALGNYIDQQVRFTLRTRLELAGLQQSAESIVRISRREHELPGGDLTFRRPDARVGNVAYDVTVARKTLSTPQIRGFFNTRFEPTHVIIIRPQQLDDGGSYVITRPGGRR